MKSIIVAFILLLLVYPVFSDDLENSGQWLKINWANDFFFQSDRYFTNGFNFEYYSTGLGNSFVKYLHLPDQTNGKNYYGFGLKQDMFTPGDFHHYSHLGDDRPFASYLVISSNKTQTNNHSKLITKSEIEVGFIGQESGGQWVQNGIHSLLPASSFVPGWENQIQTDFILNYGIEVEKNLLSSQIISLSGYIGGKLGTLHTYSGAGFRIRAGTIHDYFKNLNFSSESDWQGYFFTSLGAKYVLYNATIQGGLLNRTENLNVPRISQFVYEVGSGINMSIRNINIEVGAKYLSPEFISGSSHYWGYISVKIGL